MGYFDAIKAQRTSSAVTPTAPNVVPLHGEIHPYAAAIRRAWLERLDALPRPWYKGAAWDQNCFVSARKLIELANSPWSGYKLTDAEGDYMAHAPHDNAWDQREKCWRQAVDRTGGMGLPEPPEGEAIPSVTILDSDVVADLDAQETDDFWNSRDMLRHILDFARARRVSPWAVLGCVLTRVVCATPYHVVLPPTIGGEASLNIFVGLVGKSGSGKGAAEAVATEAVPVGDLITHKTGSGEGIAHGYKRRTKDGVEWLDDNPDHAVLFSVPEIDTLSALGNRQGATLMPELRSAWSGETLGFGYADPSKRLPIEAHQYRLCLVAGIQPGRAQSLLDDADGGTPQRFLWMPAVDPDAPDTPPSAPPPWRWTPPNTSAKAVLKQPSGRIHMSLCQTAHTEIDQNRLARLRGDGEALDGHGLLARLKVAAALALLDSRLDVTEEDWTLAGVIHRKSDATRAGIQRHLAQAGEQRNAARAMAEAQRSQIVAETVEEATIRKVAQAAKRKLKAGEWVPRGEIRKAITSSQRGFFDAAMDRLEAAGDIEIEGGSGAVRYRLKEV